MLMTNPGGTFEPDLRHFAKVGTLAAEQHLVFAVANIERVDVRSQFAPLFLYVSEKLRGRIREGGPVRAVVGM